MSVLNPERVEADATTKPITEVVEQVNRIVGPQITAFIAGVRDPKMVSRWIHQKNRPREQAEMRLRCGYRLAVLIESAYGPETTRAWFFGSNTRLDDEAPASVLRHASTPDELRFVVPAARAFAGGAD